MKIDLTIVIPTYNEERDILDCLNSIAMQNYPKSLYEVIIVDNYSVDNTVKIAKGFSKKINLKIIKSKIKDAEFSKKLGFDKANGKFFMYMDADMRYSDKNFIKKMLYPLKKEDSIAGTLVKFTVNPNHPALTRTLSYDEFQRDPIFRFFTKGIEDITLTKNKDYWLCRCNKKTIPPQGLMIYRKDLIEDYAKNQKQLIDNEIPAVLIEQGNIYFAYVPSTGVEHLLLRSLKEIWLKRIRNLKRTYLPNIKQRKFRWINWKKDWIKVGIWLIYTHSIFPLFTAVYRSIKYRDLCFFNEPMINIVSTYSIIWGLLFSNKR